MSNLIDWTTLAILVEAMTAIAGILLGFYVGWGLGYRKGTKHMDRCLEELSNCKHKGDKNA